MGVPCALVKTLKLAIHYSMPLKHLCALTNLVVLRTAGQQQDHGSWICRVEALWKREVLVQQMPCSRYVFPFLEQ